MSGGRSNRAAAVLLNLCLLERRSLARRVLVTGAIKARRLVTARTDPLVERSVGGRPILLPLSHDLPLILRDYPRYGQNLVNIVDAVAREKGPRGFIDVGANIGDTVVMVRSRTNVPVLAIEGDEVYAPLLE